MKLDQHISTDSALVPQSYLETVALNTLAWSNEATPGHLRQPTRGPGAAHQGRSAARTSNPPRPTETHRREIADLQAFWSMEGREPRSHRRSTLRPEPGHVEVAQRASEVSWSAATLALI